MGISYGQAVTSGWRISAAPLKTGRWFAAGRAAESIGAGGTRQTRRRINDMRKPVRWRTLAGLV
ncbi:hypothetical protein OIU92_00110 [Escherichia coli]|nr:hypothetical protein [Escherichia coli]